MGIVHHLSALALGPAVKTACDAAGLNLTDGSTEGVSGFLAARFKDNSQRLAEALHQANARAWQTLEVALAGDSWWQRVKGLLGPREDQTLAHQVRAFLDATPLPELAGKTKYREACLAELRGARKARLLGGKGPEATAAADLFVRFVDPRSLLAAEGNLLDRIALELQQADYRNLAHLLTLQARQGQSLLTVAARYFFRRAVEDDSRLFQGLAFTFLDSLQTDQAQAFAALNLTLNEQGERLQTLLLEVQAVVVETHAAVLDVQEEQRRQGELAGDIYKAVGDLQRRLDLMQPQVRPRDSLSIRTDAERQLVKQVVARYRALPEEQRRGLPALLNAVGKLEVAAGDFETAQHDFATVATLTSDTQAKGEAHANAYRAALERRDWNAALRELIEAVKLDGKRFAPFPVGKYHPLRILGAGGFGVAFLCRHKQLDADVVVKTLSDDDLEREVDQVFTEARALWQLDHPAIIRLLDCGYTFPNTKTRPYFVMHYFDGQTLEEHVKAHGPLAPADLVEVARQMAHGLHAAHAKDILHRDVKPANVLLRKDVGGWFVKLIDFGLAMKQRVLQNANTLQHGHTILSSSIAGTLDYAAPEQLGKLPGVRIGPQADIYGFAKTLCFALFESPEPTFQDYQRAPEWAELLGLCLNKNPDRRPANLTEVLDRLNLIADFRLQIADLKKTPDGPASNLQSAICNLQFPTTPPPAPTTQEPMRESEAEVAARWDVLKTQLQKQMRASEWDGAWDTVDDMLVIKPFSREILEARDYLEAHRTAPKPPAPQALSSRTLDVEVLRILKESAAAGLLVAPNIPATKLHNASKSCGLPAGESVLGLIDCTTFGSASDCVLFGKSALYYHNSLSGCQPNPGVVPYREFPRCNFAKSWMFCISVRENYTLSLSGASTNRGKVIEMLNAIKEAAAQREAVGTPVAVRKPPQKDLSVLPERVAQILQGFTAQSGLYLAPNIPAKKLANALAKAQVPADETVLGLIDCTVFGSASDSLIFASRGFYYQNMGGSNPNPGAVPYSEFPECQFATYWLNCISLGKDRYCNKAGASVGRDKIIEMLTAIKQAVVDLSA